MKIKLTESDLKYIIKKILKESNDIYNSREGGLTAQKINDGITLYHRPKDSTVIIAGKKLSIVESLFTYGFSREFTSTNGGNMYGPGVYTVYNLQSSTEKATGYGRAIIMVKLIGGYKDFLILSSKLAKETYGNNWKPNDQIKYLFPDKFDEIYRECPVIGMQNEDDLENPLLFDINGNEVSNDGSIYHSADSMYRITSLLRGYENLGKCRGWIYNGGHDGDCCVIRDFQSAIPVAVSYDNGATWENHLNQEMIDRISGDVDTKFQYGGKYAKVAEKAINGFTMVWNEQGEVNYIPVGEEEPISEMWFDSGFNFEHSKNGALKANVIYNGEQYLIFCINGKFLLTYPDGEQIGFLDEL